MSEGRLKIVNYSGDAAEQVVRMSLQGAEVAAKQEIPKPSKAKER